MKHIGGTGGFGLGFLLGLTLYVGMAVPGRASAQDRLELVDSGRAFNENFSGNTKVSGNMLASLAYENPSDKLNVNSVYLATSGDNDASHICIQMTTADGRYWASNLYAAKGPFETYPSVDIQTKYPKLLQEYRGSDFLITATMTDDCRRTLDKRIVPAVFDKEQKTLPLLVKVIVSRGRTRAWIEKGDAAVTEPVACETPPGGAKLAYSQVCAISGTHALAAGEYRLVIEVRSLTGSTQKSRYPILLE